MQFRDLAENLIGSKVKIKLIRHLLSEETVTSEREIAKLIGVSHSAINKALKELHEQNLITPTRVGNVLIWYLNKQSYAYEKLKNLFPLLKEKPLDKLKDMLTNLSDTHPYVKRLVIYGSVANGAELPNSDIDLFILVEDKKHVNDIESYVTFLNGNWMPIFGNKLSPNIFTYKEFSDPKNKKFLENVSKGTVVFDK